MSTSRSCSWCHANNFVVPFTRNYCKQCHHRADLSRIECDCDVCKRGTALAAERRRQAASVALYVAEGGTGCMAHAADVRAAHPGPWSMGWIQVTRKLPRLMADVRDSLNNPVAGLYLDATTLAGSDAIANRALALAAPELLVVFTTVRKLISDLEQHAPNALVFAEVRVLVDYLNRRAAELFKTQNVVTPEPKNGEKP